MRNVRKDILETLGCVPGLISHTDRSYEHFQDDYLWQTAARELYLSILYAIGGVIKWLVEDAGCMYECFVS